MRVAGPIFAFLVFPLLPVLVVVTVPTGYGPRYLDRGVIAVLVALAATFASGAIGYRRRGNPATATLFAVGTVLVSVGVFFAFIAWVFRGCGDHGTC